MPCSDGCGCGCNHTSYETEWREASRAACDMRTIIRRAGLECELTQETLRWVRNHDKEDAERIARETQNKIRENCRLKALKKLSLEERRVLGL